MDDKALSLAADFGTQSVRLSIFDKTGKTVYFDKERYEQPYFSIKPGYAEQHPEFYYDNFYILLYIYQKIN